MGASAATLDDGPPAAPETTGVWLPAPTEELESPERLAEPPLTGVAAIRGDFLRGRLAAARFISTVRGAEVAVTTAWIGAGADGAHRTVLVSGLRDRVRIAAGRIVVRDAPVLLGEVSGLSRRLRRPLDPRSSAPEWDAPRGATSPGLDGASVALASAPVSRSTTAAPDPWHLWALCGRIPADGDRLLAAGIAGHAARWEAAASLARREPPDGAASAEDSASPGGGRFGSVAARWRGGGAAVSLEALFSPELGPALLASAGVADTRSPLRFETRWRRRAGERRAVASEFAAEIAAWRSGVARLTWRPWSATAFADDGAVELDGRIRPAGSPGAMRFRVGRRGGEGSLAAVAVDGAGVSAAPERYVVLDLPLAGEGGRLVSLLASRRERGNANARETGTTAGVRARIGWRERAGVTAQVEAARTRGSTALGGGAAWSSAPTPSGGETLAPRGSSGVYATVSGWVRVGAVVVRLHAQDGESDRGGRPLAATVSMEWSGSAMRNKAPGEAGSGG